jgi:predicted dehydrogenase
MLGDVTEVTADLRNSGLLELEVEDSTDVLLRFKSGVVGNIHLDYLTRPPNHSFEIIGSDGKLEWDNEDGAVRWWSTSTDSWSTISVPSGFDRNQMFLDEMSHFLRVMAGDEPPICSLQDGIQALEISLAALQSASKGSRIALPLVENKREKA